MRKKNDIFLLAVILLIVVLLLTAGYFVLHTTAAAESIARLILYNFTSSKNITIEKIDGTIGSKASLHNIYITNPRKLPLGSEIKIQRMDFSLNEFKLTSAEVSIYNGRLNLPFSDTVLFYGSYKDGVLDLTLYSKRVSAREIIDLFTYRPVLSTLSGVLSEVNIHIAGTMSELVAEGSFYIEKIVKERFSLVNCKGSMLMYCDNLFNAAKLSGEIVLRGGLVSGGKTATIKLGTSKIIFDKDPVRPKLDIRGSAKVNDVDINMVLQGTVDNPKLFLSSSPSLTQELLLVMLATGHAWSGTQNTMQSGRMSPELIKDFVDYFLMAGTGSKIASQLGISDISLIYSDKTNTMGLSTSFVDKMKVGYEVQTPKNDGKGSSQEAATHTVKGEVKITKTVSVGAQKDVTQTKSEQLDEKNQAEEGEEKVYLQFKKKF